MAEPPAEERPIDPLAKAAYAVWGDFRWIEEYMAGFVANRHTDPARAEQELGYLTHAVETAYPNMRRLILMVLAGEQINRELRLPKGLLVSIGSREAGPNLSTQPPPG